MGVPSRLKFTFQWLGEVYNWNNILCMNRKVVEMKVTRLYTGPDEESHFEHVEIPLKDVGRINLQQSELMKATGIFFRETSVDYQWDWHNASRRQFLVVLGGTVEIEIGDGTRRQFGPGDVLLAEDTTGRGHISRTVNNQPRTSVFVTLD